MNTVDILCQDIMTSSCNPRKTYQTRNITIDILETRRAEVHHSSVVTLKGSVK